MPNSPNGTIFFNLDKLLKLNKKKTKKKNPTNRLQQFKPLNVRADKSKDFEYKKLNNIK